MTYAKQTRINRDQINTVTRGVLDALKTLNRAGGPAKDPAFKYNYPGLIAKLRNHLSEILTEMGHPYPAQASTAPGDRLLPDSDQVGTYPRFTIGTTGLIDTIEDYFVSRDTGQGEIATDTNDFHAAIVAIQTATGKTSLNGVEHRANYAHMKPGTGTGSPNPIKTATEAKKIGIDLTNGKYRLDDTPGLSGNVNISPAITKPALCVGIWTVSAYVSHITRDQYREPVDILLPYTKASQMCIGIGWWPSSI